MSQGRPSILFDLYVASQLTGQLLELEFAGSEVPVEDFALYNALVHFERATPTQLAHHLGMPLSTLLFRFGKIESRGHGVRRRNPRDGRSSLVGLSVEGRRAFDRTRPGFLGAVRSIHHHLAIDGRPWLTPKNYKIDLSTSSLMYFGLAEVRSCGVTRA